MVRCLRLVPSSRNGRCPLLFVLCLAGLTAPALVVLGATPDAAQGRAEVVIEEEDAEKADSKQPAPALKGVIFVTLSDSVSGNLESAEGVRTAKVPALDTAEFRRTMAEYLGKPVTAGLTRQMARAAAAYYRRQTGRDVEVVAAGQDSASGAVQLVVVERKVGQVSVEGNRWFGESVMRGVIATAPGDTLAVSALQQELRRLNKNQFRSVKALLKPGARAEETDVVFKTEDRFPVRFSIGYEDTGNEGSGYSRIVEGFQWGNAFMQGHELSYQHTSGLDYEQYAGHSLTYRVPLPLTGHDLTANGSYSSERWPLNPGRDLDIWWQYGLRYGVELPQRGGYTQRLEGGFDHKRRDYDPDGDSKFVTDLVQFQVQYDGALKDRWGGTTFSVIGVASPGSLTDRNTARNLGRERTGVRPRYADVYVSLERIWSLAAGVTLQNRIIGQVTSARLPYAEQLGFGGFETVRGYDESKIGADQGLLVSAELRSPAFLLGRFGEGEELAHRLQALAFFDAGFGDTKCRKQDEEDSEKLESAGVGVRYSMGKHVTLRLDYAWRLKETEDGDGRTGRVHMGVTVSY